MPQSSVYSLMLAGSFAMLGPQSSCHDALGSISFFARQRIEMPCLRSRMSHSFLRPLISQKGWFDLTG